MPDITFTIKESFADESQPIFQLYTETPLHRYCVITELLKANTTLAQMTAFVTAMNTYKMTTETTRADLQTAIDTELATARGVNADPVNANPWVLPALAFKAYSYKINGTESHAINVTPKVAFTATVYTFKASEYTRDNINAVVDLMNSENFDGKTDIDSLRNAIENFIKTVKPTDTADSLKFEVVDTRASYGVAVHLLTITPSIYAVTGIMEFTQKDFQHGAILLLAQTLNGEQINPGRHTLDSLRSHIENTLKEVYKVHPELQNTIIQKKVPAKQSAFNTQPKPVHTVAPKPATKPVSEPVKATKPVIEPTIEVKATKTVKATKPTSEVKPVIEPTIEVKPATKTVKATKPTSEVKPVSEPTIEVKAVSEPPGQTVEGVIDLKSTVKDKLTMTSKAQAQANYTTLEKAVTDVLAEIAASENSVTGEETASEKTAKATALLNLRKSYASATQALQPALEAFVAEFGTAPTLTVPDYVSVPEVKKARKVSDAKCSEVELNDRILALSLKCDGYSVAYTTKPSPAKYERLAKANKAYQEATALFIERFPDSQVIGCAPNASEPVSEPVSEVKPVSEPTIEVKPVIEPVIEVKATKTVIEPVIEVKATKTVQATKTVKAVSEPETNLSDMFDFSVATSAASSFEEVASENIDSDSDSDTAKAVKAYVKAKKAEPVKVKKVIAPIVKATKPVSEPVKATEPTIEVKPVIEPTIEVKAVIEPTIEVKATEPTIEVKAVIEPVNIQALENTEKNWLELKAIIAGYTRNERAKKLGFRTMTKDAWLKCKDIKAQAIEGFNRTAAGMWETCQSHPDYVCNKHISEKIALFPGYTAFKGDDAIIFYNLMLRYQAVLKSHFDGQNITDELLRFELKDTRSKLMFQFPYINNLMATNSDKIEFARLTELEIALTNAVDGIYNNYSHPEAYNIAMRELTDAELATARLAWRTPEQRAIDAVLAVMEPSDDAPFEVQSIKHPLIEPLTAVEDVDAPFDLIAPDSLLKANIAPSESIPSPSDTDTSEPDDFFIYSEPVSEPTIEVKPVSEPTIEVKPVSEPTTESDKVFTPECLTSQPDDMQPKPATETSVFLAVDNSDVMTLEADKKGKLATKKPVGNAAKGQPDGHYDYQDNKSAEWLEAQAKRLAGDAPEPETEGMPLFAIVRYIRDVLNHAGYITEYSANGNFGGLNIFKRVKLDCDGVDHTVSEKGQFELSTRLEVTDKTVSELYRVLMKSPPKTSAKGYRAIVTELLNAPGDVNSAILKLTSTRKADSHGRTTLTGATNAVRFCPTTATSQLVLSYEECFKLLSIFDEPEARALMLTLGRVVVGENGSVTTEGTVIQHTARMLTLVVGVDPGLGKTTLFEQFLIPCIQKLGYKVAGVPLGLNDKGWIAPALADLAFVDDLTAVSQQQIFESAIIKSLVSNVELTLDAKYKAFVGVKSRCQVIMCSNGYSMADSLSADSGVMSRLHALATVPASKVYRPKQNFDERTLTVWNNEAKARGVSVECLAYALLARCSEYFLDTNGYTFTGEKYERTAPDLLMLTTEALREQYRLKVTMSHAKTLVQSIAHLVAVNIILDTPAGSYDRQTAINKLMRTEFKPLDIVKYVRFGLANLDRKMSDDDLLNNTELHTFNSARNMRKIRATTADGEMTNADTLLMVVDKLESNAGFKYPRTMSFYCSMWTSAISEASYNFEELERTIASDKLRFNLGA